MNRTTQDSRYREAYERLRRMIDRELLEHISDESNRFCERIMAILTDLRGVVTAAEGF